MAKLCASGFRAHEGTALCFRILAGRAHAGSGAMKAVGEYLRGRKEAEEIVDNGGIKTLGRIFMGRGKPKMVTGLTAGKKLKREKRNWERGIEEKVVEVVYLLTRHLVGGEEREYTERMLAKFLESEVRNGGDRGRTF